MIPISPVVPGCFEDHDTVFGKDQLEYLPLPAHVEGDGTITTRWKLSWRERFRIMWTGDMWLQIMTFNLPVQPVKLTTQCPISVPFVYQAPDESDV